MFRDKKWTCIPSTYLYAWDCRLCLVHGVSRCMFLTTFKIQIGISVSNSSWSMLTLSRSLAITRTTCCKISLQFVFMYFLRFLEYTWTSPRTYRPNRPITDWFIEGAIVFLFHCDVRDSEQFGWTTVYNGLMCPCCISSKWAVKHVGKCSALLYNYMFHSFHIRHNH